ncbi:MAG: FAD-dependent oxidoreductase [Parvularculaceae bacterium]
MQTRHLTTPHRRAMLAAGGGALLSACSVTGGMKRPAFARPAPLAPLDVSEGRLTKITVCRPFRPTGPRLEAEAIAGKKIVHNYGHGGSGWSLSWGCAEEAAALALEGGARKIAVIGAGVMGLTTAVRLAEAGASVTIYAKEFPAETRSARATGVWSPSSRIGLAPDVASGFEERWEGWARASYARHQHYVGAAAEPVEYVQQYYLPADDGAASQPAAHEFLHLDRRVRDMTPQWGDIPREMNPFPVARARGGQVMSFNVASYAATLTRDFLLRGGQMLRREFPDRAAILALPEPVIVNCTGFAAKALWNDEALVPVRGQINWLTPQPAARYALIHHQVFVISRRDGVVVQYVGPNDDWGYGDDNETASREEMTDALSRIAPLFA